MLPLPSAIQVYDPGDAILGSYDLRQTGVGFTTTEPGGCGTLSFEFPARYPFGGAIEQWENNKVELVDGQGLYFRARLEKPKLSLGGSAGNSWKMTSYGYNSTLNDQRVFDQAAFAAAGVYNDVYYGPGRVQDIFRELIRTYCPDISTDFRLVDDLGGQLLTGQVGAYSVHNDTPQKVFADLIKLGTLDGRPASYYVWEGDPGAGQKAMLEVSALPTSPTYWLAISQGVSLDLEWDLGGMFNRVYVRYGRNGVGTVMVEDVVSQGERPGYRVRRDTSADVKSVLTSTDARAVGNALLKKLATTRLVTSRIELPADRSMLVLDDNERIVPPWRMRAGGRVGIRELETGTTQDSRKHFAIAQTDWKQDTGVQTLTPEGHQDMTALVAGVVEKMLDLSARTR